MFNVRRKMIVLVAGLVSMAGADRAWGWNATGHMMVARQAWEEMTPEERGKVSQILKGLPHYELLLKYMPEGYAEPEKFAFMEAATWPDNIRSENHPEHGEHHPKWHYVDYPINPENVQADPEPVEVWDGKSDPENLLQALQKSRKELADPNTPADRRAIALCWVEHLVGDIHQPLHATSLFSKQYPTGDRGGNSFVVKSPEGTGPNATTGLHGIWDNMLGISRKADVIDKNVERLEKDPKFSREGMKEDLAKAEPKEWAKESWDLALANAYQNAQLKGATKELLQSDPKAEAPALPVGYMEKAREIADRRVMLAGDRLADVIKGGIGK